MVSLLAKVTDSIIWLASKLGTASTKDDSNRLKKLLDKIIVTNRIKCIFFIQPIE